jgi:stage II sporulation protein AA (anti-sigma F factor antagonist)
MDARQVEFMTDAVPVIQATGRLDNSTSAAFEKELLDRLAQGDKLLVLDFSNLTFISSAGLRTVLLVAKTLKAGGGRLALCALSKPVKEIFDLTGIGALIDIFPTYEAAASHLSMQ